MGKLENFLLWGIAVLLAGVGVNYMTEIPYLGGTSVLIGFFIIVWGIVKYGNI